MNLTNNTSNTLISGTTGNDSIQNYGDSVTIGGSNGNDTLWNDYPNDPKAGSNVLLDGGIDNDVFSNDGNYSTLIGGAGNDSINNFGSNVIVDGGSGNDTIHNYDESSNSTISGDEGNDYIYNNGSNSTIEGGAGNDTIYNRVAYTGDAANVIINGDSGNDSIRNEGNQVSIDAGAGNDTIRNGYNVNDEEDKVTLNGGDGNDYIYNNNDGDVTTIFGGNGNDTIENNGDTISIDAGAGNDSIYSYSNTGTIKGGTGNDTITFSRGMNNLILYNAGDGNDIINGFKSDSTLSIAGGVYSSTKSGNDVIVTVGNGKITLKGAASLSKVNIVGTVGQRGIFVDKNYFNDKSNVLLVGNDANNSIRNFGTNVKIQANGGNDFIDNYIHHVTIDAGAGNDTLHNDGYGGYSSLSGGAGNDSIRNSGGYNVTSSGGDGNDTIDNYGYYDKIDGGAGDDYISISSYGKNNLIIYNVGDGNDLITGFQSDSTLSISGGQYVSSKSGNDVIVTAQDGAKITLAGAANLSRLNIAAGLRGIFVYKNYNNKKDYVLLVGNDANNIIRNSGAQVTISGADGDDSINNLSSNVSILGDAGNDSISNSALKVMINGGTGNDYIDNRGQNAKIDGGAGNDYIDNRGQNAKIDGGAGNDSITNKGNDITISGGDGNDTIYNYGYYDKIDGGAGDDLIDNDLYSTNASIVGGAGNDTIQNQSARNSTIDGGTGDDLIYAVGYYALIKYNVGDGNDRIQGFRAGSTLSIAGGQYFSSKSGNDVIVTAQDGARITLAGAANLSRLNIVGQRGIIIDKEYDNSQSNVMLGGTDSNNTIKNSSGDNVIILGNGGNDYIYNGYMGDRVTIDGGADNDTIFNNSGFNVSIDGGVGDDSIKNYGSNVTISGGTGNDSIYNDGSNVTISGGAGNDYISIASSGKNDLIVYNAGDGNDVVKGFRADSTLSIAGAAVFSAKSGNDVIVTVGGNKITLQGAASLSKVNIIETPMNISNADNNKIITTTNVKDTIKNTGEKVRINALSGNDTITNTGDNTSIDGGAGNDTIWNEVDGDSTGGKKVSLNGGVGNDVIANDGENATILGGADNDSIRNWSDNVTIDGGTGNDTLWNEVGGEPAAGKKVSISGGAGNDVLANDGESSTLIGGDDNDTIQNWGANAKISGDKGNDSLWNDGNNVIFNYNSGEGNDIIQGFKANSTLSINGGVYATSQKSGNDVIVTVGNGKITLQGAAALSTVNIVETPKYINNTASNKIVYGTNANDTIINTGDKVTIRALGGKDSINNNAAQVSIEGGDGYDTILNKGKNVTISSQSGNDLIKNENSNVSIDGGAGNDSLVSNGSNVTMTGGDGNDTLENNTDSDKVFIVGAAGNDFIQNAGNNVTISGDAGHDTISSKSTSTSISTADGNDSINLQASYQNTINAGKGSDTIKLDMNSNKIFIQHAMGDGNDVIEGFNSTATLQIGDGNNTYSKSISGDDIIITDEGGEKITLAGAATLSSVHIDGMTTVNVSNSDSEVEIFGDRLNDTIENKANNVTIHTFEGNDTIAHYAAHTTIDAGADDDTISNFNSNESSVDGGDGNDLIESRNGYKNTIRGGKGNDFIFISASKEALIQYNPGDGNDVITDFNETSTLQIGDGNDTYIKETNRFGDVIIKVSDNQIVLRNAATLSTLNILGEEEVIGQVIPNNENSVKISGTEANDTINNFGSSVTVEALGGNDSIRNTSSNVTIDAGAGHDSITNEKTATNVSIDAGAGNDSITNKGNDITISGGEDSDSILNEGNNVLFAYTAGDGNDVITGFKANSSLSISGELYSLQTSGNDVIAHVDDSKITLVGAAKLSTVNVIGTPDKPASRISNSTANSLVTGGNAKDTITNDGQGATIIAYGGSDTVYNSGGYGRGGRYAFIDGGTGNDSLVNNNSSHVTIDGGEGDDRIINKGKNAVRASLYGGEGNDYIRNDIGNSATLNGGDGDDYLSDYSYYSRIIGGKGNDVIYLQNRDQEELIIYNTGDGNDLVRRFNTTATLQVDGGKGTYTTQKSGNDVIVHVGEGQITLEGGASLSRLNIHGVKKETAVLVNNTLRGSSITGTEGNDTITNSGANVTINAIDGNDIITNNGSGNNALIDAGDGYDTIANNNAQNVSVAAGAGNDSIFNNGNYAFLSGDAGDDTLTNDAAFFSSISGAEGNDLINVTKSTNITVNGGAGNDSIKLDSSSTALIEYDAGDGNDVIEGFSSNSTLEIVDDFSTTKSGNDLIVTVGEGKVTLKGAANLNNLHIGYDDDDYDYDDDDDSSVSFVVMNSKVTSSTTGFVSYAIANAYQYNQNFSVLNVSSALDNPVKVTNGKDSAIKANGSFGTAILSSGNVLEYAKNNVALTSENYGDKISFSQDTTLNYGEIQVELLSGSVLSTNGAKEITFDNNSSANITAPEGAKINVKSGTFSINNLPVNSTSGAGTITVTADGLSFNGYGAQFVALQVAKENYLGNAAPMTIAYNSADESYTIQNNACVKTLSNDFTKLTFDISAAEDYANYEVNGKEFLIASDADNINVIEANDNTFKIQGKEFDAEKIGRVTIDEQITFSGTEINFDGVQVNYALNKPVIYSLDGKTISINDAATLATGDETKTFSCEAGSYTVNGRTFETTADLTFTADANEIRIPLSDVETEIYFDGVQVSGESGEIVFDLANDKISIPDGATINFTSHDDIKLNMAAGNFIIDGKEISSDIELEITANKESLQVPLSENPVTINDAKITGTGTALATIDNTNAIFFSILLPDGALVQNTSGNTFELTGKGSSAYFGDTNKKVQLIDDGTAYIDFSDENSIGVGFNALTFEQIEIKGNDSWTVETSGTSGIDKITGITDGATITTSTEYIDAGDLRFEVETKGAGSFNICGEKITTTGDETYVVYGNSDGEIKVAPKGEEYADDDSEAAGNSYQYATAGDYTVNGITFHATENSKVQTITRGVEFDLSSGTFQFDGLTLSGNGTAQINRYNTSLISLTDGAIVSSNDKSKYQNRQFLVEGAVEIAGKKFETNSPTRCALLNLEYAIEDFYFSISGFAVRDKYVQIQNDCYEGVTVIDKKISSIEGVKASASILGNGLSNISIVTTESGEFSIRGRRYKITDDSDGVTFVTGSHGNVIEINGFEGSVEGDFTNEISVNGKAVRLTGASSVKVTSDGENITEISNVAGDLVTTDGNTYRKDIRVYELGGAEKLTTSAEGTIIFSGNKFDTSAGKTFELDEAGNISGIETAQSDDVVSAENVAEDFATMNLSTTDNLEEVFGNFSEGLTVNGVFVKVTDSTNFVVKNDAENVYIVTTAADTFTINGKTFTTSADKTIFKLDKNGNVSEIVTDSSLIEGDFNDEIIFNGKKFCVTGTNNTKISLSDESLITINLARNIVKIVKSGGAAEIAINGEGEITIGYKVLSTSEGFVGSLRASSEGVVDSVENFVGTIEGELGGLELYGITIDSDDKFSVTGDGDKITAIDNLQNGSFTCDSLDSITINGSKVSVDNSDEITVTITDGELKITGLMNGANISNTDGKIKFVTDESGEFFVNGTILNAKANDTFIGTSDSAKIINARVEEILSAENARVISGKENVTLKGGEVVVVEDTSAKVNITASKGNDTIVSEGENVSVTFKGGKTEVFATGGTMKVSGYNASTGSGFHTDYADIFAAVDEGDIVFNKGRLTIGSAVVIDDGGNNVVNFFDTASELQKVGFASDDSKLDASKETENLILIGASNSTIAGGKGSNQIRLDEDSGSTILLNGKNTVENFNASFDGDKISVDAASHDFSFDGSNVSVKSGTARALLENISSDDDAARILTLINGKEIKTAIAQEGLIIAAGNDTADIYVGKKSGVDFTGFENSLVADLSENFYGINQITLGGGQNTLISSSQNETLTSSDGTTEFIFSKDSGRDLIQNFNFDNDKINVGNETITAVNVNSAGGVRMEISGAAVLTLENAQGKNFQINNFVAKVDRNITYDAEANYFLTTSQNATLTINEGAEIWLDGSHGKYFSGDIRTLDASTAQGNTSLVGNDLDNTILAGKGDSSLWGGNLGNDFMQGSAGKNTFFYTVGNGNDTISGANNGDIVYLSQVTLDQIASTNITADAVTLNFKDGGSLQVNSAADITYQLADGSKHSANHAQATWLAK